MLTDGNLPRIAVVIPCYRVRDHILSVLSKIGDEVSAIYVVDDACPESTGQLVQTEAVDKRVVVIFSEQNEGVGGAAIRGMKRAHNDGADIIVKIDGDDQMDPSMIPAFVRVIAAGEADYTKGNRFYEFDGLSAMPLGRLLGNAGLSFLSKISTGYWHIFDPTNGFVAIHASLIDLLPLDKIAKRYFFESDMLFRLNIAGARVVDIPMHSHYADEKSGMNPLREVPRFAAAHMCNFLKRVAYNYLVRNFSVASIELLLGVPLIVFGVLFGLANWRSDAVATAGTVMLAALPIILGTQFLLAFLNYDVQSVPRSTLHVRLKATSHPRKALRRSKP